MTIKPYKHYLTIIEHRVLLLGQLTTKFDWNLKWTNLYSFTINCIMMIIPNEPFTHFFKFLIFIFLESLKQRIPSIIHIQSR